MIRISGGVLGGRVLRAPVPEGVRPTAIRTRAALFSMLGQDQSGWSWLDACGGTGLIGIEAHSRGADPVVIIERDGGIAKGIEQNLRDLKLPLRLMRGDAQKMMVPRADVVYLDPPYADAIGPWILWAAGLADHYVAAEARAGVVWPEPPPGFVADGVRRHGEGELALYARRAPTGAS